MVAVGQKRAGSHKHVTIGGLGMSELHPPRPTIQIWKQCLVSAHIARKSPPCAPWVSRRQPSAPGGKRWEAFKVAQIKLWQHDVHHGGAKSGQDTTPHLPSRHRRAGNDSEGRRAERPRHLEPKN